ncbi:UDP-glycosyltransferase 74C1-like [Neltuma alba]|uniref:UDP-glycosyltransferase 74C1-like n=1 Tax=Neltuma alba TaxID=207710 RepID=UPI0010A3812D|nr:UDP-glycosyltransferase 74C1-like [Prosopis alba]
MPNPPSNFVKETLERGMFVTWCPQVHVLSHPAVGCIVTHCGENSLMEAIVFGVPMVAIPRFADQIPNAHFVEKAWKVGVNPRKNEEGVCSKEEIERCLRELMHEEKGKDIKKNLMQLKKDAKEAVSEGGSSDKHTKEFISRLVRPTWRKEVKRMGEHEGRAHVLMLGFPGYGHITPLIQFARRLACRGIKVTFACSLSATQSIQTGNHLISLLPTYDDITQAGLRGPGGLFGFLEMFKERTTKILLDFINKSLQDCDERTKVKCLVYDSDLHWALDIAKQTGLLSATFLAQTLGSTVAYYMLNLKVHGDKLKVPALDIPDFSDTGVSHVVDGPGLDKISPVLRVVLSKFDNFGKADLYFCHTFDRMEHGALEWMKNICPTIATVGPMVPSIYLDKTMEDNRDYGFNMNKQDSNTCLEWLNTKEPNSVVYVAFGSMTDINTQQMKEMATALKNLRCNFLWVMKKTEMPNLPLNFIEETAEKGMFVTWCPQVQVLSHPAVGYTVTHCGANSLMEAMVFEVPMVGVPKFVDQIPNAYFVEKVWKVGVNPRKNEEGVCSKEEIERCLRELMYEEKGKDIKKNLMQLKKDAKEAVSEGGSSDKHIQEFIARLVHGPPHSVEQAVQV